jgi:hypothetical protein
MLLKPCSCGGKPELVLTGDPVAAPESARAHVECPNCERRTNVRVGASATERAATEWNAGELFLRLASGPIRLPKL